jgi:transposase-like protein
MPRSYAEIMGLQYEAERLVRMGESRAEVARRLGVHPQTLAGWALAHGWRKKDLDLERSGQATRQTILAIREANTVAAARERLRAQVLEALREAVTLLADGSEASLVRLKGLIEAIGEAPGRGEQPSPVQLPPDPKAPRLSLGEASLPGERPEEETDWFEDEGSAP